MRRKRNLGISVQLSFAIANPLMGQNSDAFVLYKPSLMASFCYPFVGALLMLFCAFKD